jgi:hypothetical protein
LGRKGAIDHCSYQGVGAAESQSIPRGFSAAPSFALFAGLAGFAVAAFSQGAAPILMAAHLAALALSS